MDRPETVLTIDPEVHAVVEFMQRNLQCSHMVAVAEAVAKLAPILWGRYAAEQVTPLQLVLPKPDQPRQSRSDASE
jgi:hypothetical protein